MYWVAKSAKDARQSWRLLSLATVVDGMSPEEAVRLGGMDCQPLRDWVHRFNDQGPDGLEDVRNGGAREWLSSERKAELAPIRPSWHDRT